MANFYMMVGLPGSGKTTFAHNIEKGAIVISSDIIRKELWGSEEKQGDNKIVFEELEKRVMENLAADKSVVYDATNIKAKKRKDFLYRLRKIPNVNTVCMLMSVPYEQCLERNNERGRVVPEEVIKKMTNLYGSNPKDIVVCIGPAISKCCYEVDKDCADNFYALNDLDNSKFIFPKKDGKYMIDLLETNKQIVMKAGVKEENITLSDLCTKCNSDLLWSHRATNGHRGTMCAFMCIEK